MGKPGPQNWDTVTSQKETVLYIHARYTRPHFTDAVVLEDFEVLSKEPTEISQHGIAS